MAENFLSRWARRKSEAAVPEQRAAAGPLPGATESEHDEGPSMQDVDGLRADSDFSRFVTRNVKPDVRRAALKTLFSDPHFQQMDGLDIYIDDYTRHSPLPPEMVAALWHAKSTLSPRPLWMPEEPTEAVADGAAENEETSPAQKTTSDEHALPTPEVASADDEASGNTQEQGGDAEGMSIPFNDQVNFARGREKDWNTPRPD